MPQQMRNAPLLEDQMRNFPRSYRLQTDLIEESYSTIHLIERFAVLAHNLSEVPPRSWQAQEMEFSSYPFGGFVLNCYDLQRSMENLRNSLHQLSMIDDDLSIATPVSVPHINVVTAIRPILRGHLESTRATPLVEHFTPAVLRFIEIVGLRERLDRDHHNVGWHYHYCDSKGRRSDTLLSFDTNQPDRLDASGKVGNVPLFWEKHSEKGKQFEGRPNWWGSEKRQSVYEAAKPDLTKHQFADFRRPKNIAQPVWPIDATLSARPLILKS